MRLGVASFISSSLTAALFLFGRKTIGRIVMITQELVRKLFNYDPETGILTRRTSPAHNAQVGDIAGYLNNKGYLEVTINRKAYFNHRIIYLYHYGYLPKFIIHNNRIKTHNTIDNLRECTLPQSRLTAKIRLDNASGIKGVGWHKNLKKWRARLNINGKQKHLGFFTEISEAEKAVKAARKKHHGEFVNHG